jgi:hypothetical protein
MGSARRICRSRSPARAFAVRCGSGGPVTEAWERWKELPLGRPVEGMDRNDKRDGDCECGGAGGYASMAIAARY